MIQYTVGLLFSPDLKEVALIKKLRPAFQVGLLNGIGGHLEGDEPMHEGMSREFEEEAGVLIQNWEYIGKHSDESTFAVHFFYFKAETKVDLIKKTDEEVGWFVIDQIPSDWFVPPCEMVIQKSLEILRKYQ